jgi:uncharacterized coiled-coil protein SlyX
MVETTGAFAMAEPDNLVLTLLREIRTDMDAGFEDVRTRLAKQDKTIESLGQAMRGETILGQYATAGVDERLDAIEKRLDAIEARG